MRDEDNLTRTWNYVRTEWIFDVPPLVQSRLLKAEISHRRRKGGRYFLCVCVSVDCQLLQFSTHVRENNKFKAFK